MWTGFFSKSGHSDNSIRGNQVKVSLHLFLLQVWVRLTDIPGLCWISWRFSVHSVDAGHWYRRVPATAPHRRKRREFQSVNPTSVSLGSVASSNLSPVNSSQNELWSTHVVRIHHPFYCLPLTDAKLASMCSLVSCDLWRSERVLERYRLCGWGTLRYWTSCYWRRLSKFQWLKSMKHSKNLNILHPAALAH